MPVTVWGAFDAFRKNTVDLDPDDTKTARTSRDYLFTQLQTLEPKVLSFPVLYGDFR